VSVKGDLRVNLCMLSHRKYKIPNCQNGHAYLTSHRACYVDNEEPRKNSVAVALRDVDRYEFYVCASTKKAILETLANLV
jgi:Vacuolar protein sorting protein 36 Vps36